MNVQDAKSLTIPEGSVKMIHDNGNRLLWGAVGYNTKYAGNTTQETTTGKNLVDLVPATNTMPDKTQSATFNTVYDSTLERNVLHASGTASYPYIGFTLPNRLTSGKYYAFMIKYRTLTTTTGDVSSDAKNFRMYPGRNNLYSNNTPTGTGRIKDESGANNIKLYDTQTYLTRCIRFYADPDVYDTSSTPAWYTGFSLSWVPAGVSGNISAKEIWIADIQIYEISQTDWNSNNYTGTDFEKYTGGQPSPSPDYPETINVVTGSQTVTVSDGTLSEAFTVDLGATEFCKIGDYQDKIYQDDGSWYIHKETGVTTDTVGSTDITIAGMVGNGGIYSYCGGTVNGTTVTYTSALLVENTIYYQLATPTDTQITDTTLISQLNAVHEWLTRYGYNSTVTGNLPIIIDRTNL